MTTLSELKQALKDAQKYVRLNDRMGSIDSLEKVDKLLAIFVEPKITAPKTQLACLQAIAESLAKSAEIAESQRSI